MLEKARYYRAQYGLLPMLALSLRSLVGLLRSGLFRLLFRLRFCFQKGQLAKRFGGKTLLVFTPTVEWHDLFARAQQMASAFGRRKDCVAVYLTTQRQYDRVFGWQELRPGVIVANVCLAKRLDTLTKDAAAVITTVYNLTSADIRLQYHSNKLVYEYVDDLHLIVSPAVEFAPWQEKHLTLLQAADLSVATASKLYEEIAPDARQPLLLPNAVEFDFFAAPAAPEAKLAAVCAPYGCVLGYTGALADWFDYEAVRQSALAHPDWLWLLVGRVIGSGLKNSGVLELPNVRHFAPVAYEELPGFLAVMDILTIPFALNEITQATSPVKLFEYMAAGKPVISANLPECRKYAPVLRYRRAADLDTLVPQALTLRKDAAYRESLREIARKNTWAARCEQALAALNLD